MSPAAVLDGRVALVSMDEPVGEGVDDGGDEPDLHECLASSGEDPALQGARELDWELALGSLASEDRGILSATAAGVPGVELGLRYDVTPARITQRKREIGGRMREVLGESVLADCVREPAWESHMRAHRERRACRYG